MTFGEKLSNLRKEQNYTQEQLADILGVSRQSISKWESDIAFPETEKLIKMSKLFSCSIDYLLNDDVTEKKEEPKREEAFLDKLKNVFWERKSEKTVMGMPLYHIGRDARGFFAVGLKAKGFFALGLMARGIFSFGLLSLGLISVGLLALGAVAVGTLAVGLLAVATLALGIFAVGAISVGIVSLGALSVGMFSAGALAVGEYIAMGDHAYAMIAIGESIAEGSEYSAVCALDAADTGHICNLLDALVPAWLSWAKEVFKFFLC